MPQSSRQPEPHDPSRTAAGGRSEAARAVATGAIALWLLGLVLSIMGNSDSGASAFVRTVKGRLFSPWLTPLWLDLGFDYRLTYGGPEDADHALDIGRHGDEPGTGVTWPGRVVGERAARWRRLARAISADVDDADRDGLLAAAAGRGAFDRLGTQDVTVRVLRTPPRDRGAASSAPTAAYAARVRFAGGELQLLRQEARGEVAPLVRPATPAATRAAGEAR